MTPSRGSLYGGGAFFVGAPAPAVSGGSGGGSGSLVVNGSGFGTKSVVAPLFFSTFESDTVGDVSSSGINVNDIFAGLKHLQISGTWTEGVQTSVKHSGTKCPRVIYASADGFPNLGVDLPAGSLSCYRSGWIRLDHISGGGGDQIQIGKFGRAGCNAPYSGDPSCFETFGLAGPNDDIGFNTDPAAGGGAHFQNDGTITTYPEDIYTLGTWAFSEHIYKLGTPGVADGLVQLKWNALDLRSPNSATMMTRASGVTDTLAWAIHLFDGASNVTGTYHLYGDEIYIDNSLARVIVTNNATYARPNSTKFAPQAPTAWSNTQITVATPNWSDLSPGAAWAHVWDSSNAYVGAVSVTVP